MTCSPSAHSSPASAASTSASSAPACAAAGKSNSTPSAAPSSPTTGQTCDATTTSERGLSSTNGSAATTCERPTASTSSPRDSLASPYPSQASAEAKTTSDGFGQTSPGCFAIYDRVTCFWRTCQASFAWVLTPFSPTWPTSGLMRSGRCYPRRSLGLRTCENASGSLPTPQASCTGYNQSLGSNASVRPSLETMARKGMLPTPTTVDSHGHGYTRDRGEVGKERLTLTGMARLLATPTARDWRSGKCSQATMERNSRPLSEQAGGPLNPRFVAEMMGFPADWLDVNWKPSATRSASRSSNGSARGSSRTRRAAE